MSGFRCGVTAGGEPAGGGADWRIHALIKLDGGFGREITACAGEAAVLADGTFDPLHDSACPACREVVIASLDPYRPSLPGNPAP